MVSEPIMPIKPQAYAPKMRTLGRNVRVCELFLENNKKYVEIAEIMGLSHSRISQIVYTMASRSRPWLSEDMQRRVLGAMQRDLWKIRDVLMPAIRQYETYVRSYHKNKVQ